MNDRRDAAKNIAGAMFAPTTLELDNPQSAITTVPLKVE
jgi:hypothetical protein